MTKQAYESPQLIELGTFEDLTQAASPDFDFLDKEFPAGTPRGELTFS